MSDYKIASIVPLSDDSKDARMAVALKEMAALTSERDQLRAELAAAKEERDRLAVDNERLREKVRRLTQANADLRKERDRAVAEAQRQDGVAKGLRKKLEAVE